MALPQSALAGQFCFVPSNRVIPGRRREAAANPESTLLVGGYGFQVLGRRPSPGM